MAGQRHVMDGVGAQYEIAVHSLLNPFASLVSVTRRLRDRLLLSSSQTDGNAHGNRHRSSRAASKGRRGVAGLRRSRCAG